MEENVQRPGSKDSAWCQADEQQNPRPLASGQLQTARPCQAGLRSRVHRLTPHMPGVGVPHGGEWGAHQPPHSHSSCAFRGLPGHPQQRAPCRPGELGQPGKGPPTTHGRPPHEGTP